MKKETIITTIEEIRAKVELGNALIEENKFDEIKACEDELAEMVRSYNASLRQRQYDAWLKEESPLKVALMQGYVMQVGAGLSKGGKNEEPKFGEREGNALVNVEEFVKYAQDCKHKVVANKYWDAYIEGIASQMAAHTAKELGADLKRFEELYAVSADAKREIEEGKISVSTKAIKGIIEEAFRRMLGDDIEKLLPNKNDVKFVEVACGGLNKKNQVKIPTKKTMVKIFTVMAYTKLNGLKYEVALKEKETK